jgi:hypothetical protein
LQEIQRLHQKPTESTSPTGDGVKHILMEMVITAFWLKRMGTSPRRRYQAIEPPGRRKFNLAFAIQAMR